MDSKFRHLALLTVFMLFSCCRHVHMEDSELDEESCLANRKTNPKCEHTIDDAGHLNSFCRKTSKQWIEICPFTARGIAIKTERQISLNKSINLKDLTSVINGSAVYQQTTITIDTSDIDDCSSINSEHVVPDSLLTSFLSLQFFRMIIKYPPNTDMAKYQYNTGCLQNRAQQESQMFTDIIECIDNVVFGEFDECEQLPTNNVLPIDEIPEIVAQQTNQSKNALNGTVFSLELRLNETHILPPMYLDLIFVSNLQDRIETIILKNSGLHNFTAEGMTKEFSSTVELDLSDNDISFIDSEVFLKFPKLKKLDLSGNRLAHLPEGFHTLPNFYELHIGRNKPEEGKFLVREEDIRNIEQIKILCLSGTELIGSDLLALKKLSNLKSLYLRSCQLDSIPESFFASFFHLKTLDLSGNKMKTFSIRSDFPNLNHLNLSRNELTTNGFLKEIRLQCNGTSKCPTMSLNEVDLSYNKINSWTEQIFSKSLNIVFLNLSYNWISTVNEPMLDDFKFIQQLKLDGNRFDCLSCSLPIFQEWIQNKSNEHSLMNLTCFNPTELRGKNLMDIPIDPSHCSHEYNYSKSIILPIALSVIIFAIVVIVFIVYKRFYKPKKFIKPPTDYSDI